MTRTGSTRTRFAHGTPADRVVAIAGAMFVAVAFLPWAKTTTSWVMGWRAGMIALASIACGTAVTALSLAAITATRLPERLVDPRIGFALASAAAAFALLRALTYPALRSSAYGNWIAVLLAGVLVYATSIKTRPAA